MTNRIAIFVMGSAIFLLFVLFSYLVHEDLFTHFDFNTTVRLQDNIPRRVDNEFSILSELGNFEVLTIILLVLIAVRRKLLGLVYFASYVALHVIELYGKWFVAHAPPPHFMLRTKQLVDFPQFHVRAENSYPSGHAARTAFLSVFILFFVWRSKRLRRGWKWIITIIVIGFDLAMFISRPYLGEHWTTDVIGGMLLGTGLAIISEAFVDIPIRLFKREKFS